MLSNGGLEKVGTDYEFLLDNANASQILVEEVDLNGQQQIRKVTLEEWNGMVAGHLIGWKNLRHRFSSFYILWTLKITFNKCDVNRTKAAFEIIYVFV